MNILKYEFKSNLKSTLIWSISLGIVGFFFISIYPAFQSDVKSLDAILSNYSPEVLKAVGVGSIGIDSFPGFYSFCIVYSILCGAIQALIFGIQVISKEGSRKTGDFLFTKPVSRIIILINKYLSVLISIIITNVFYFVFTLIASLIYVENLDFKVFIILTSAFFFTQILFISIGFFIGCFLEKIKYPVSVAVGVGGVCFALQMTSNMFDEKLLEIISPLSYINPSYIAENDGYDVPMLILLIVLTVAFTVFGFIRYRTKDIKF